MTHHRSIAIAERLAAAGCIGASLLVCGSAHAQAPYPVKPIRMVLVSPPGGSTDIIGRSLAQHIAEGLGQTIVVDNKPGGGGLIAAETTAKAAPDGYTLLYTHTSHAVTPSLHRKLPYDPIADFAPVSIAVLAQSVLVVHPAMPVKTVKDLLAYARAHPGKVNFSAGSTGASAHLGGELFKKMAGIDIVHIPYKGTAAQLTALMAGEAHMSFATMPPALPHIQSGKLRAIAIGGASRSAAMPELPTVAESGVPGFDIAAWNGFLFPAKTPAAIIDRLNREVLRVSRLPEVRDRAAQQGAELVHGTPQELGAHIKAQIAKWAPVVKSAGIRAD